MTVEAGLAARLAFLMRVADKEAALLQETDSRLFSPALSLQTLERVRQDAALSERLDAFVSRFGRLQDTLADKFLPALLAAAAEPRGPAIDNLDRAEKLGWLTSTDRWLEMRKLRNLMVHEYIEDPLVLLGALQAGHGFVPTLTDTASRFVAQGQLRLAAR